MLQSGNRDADYQGPSRVPVVVEKSAFLWSISVKFENFKHVFPSLGWNQIQELKKQNNLTAAVFSDENWLKLSSSASQFSSVVLPALIQHRTAAVILRMSLWKSGTCVIGQLRLKLWKEKITESHLYIRLYMKDGFSLPHGFQWFGTFSSSHFEVFLCDFKVILWGGKAQQSFFLCQYAPQLYIISTFAALIKSSGT